jgi:hypothetical protein
MNNEDFTRLVFLVLNTEEGQVLIKELHRRYVNTDIVQVDGEIPSALRAGKSELVRYLDRIHKSKTEE